MVPQRPNDWLVPVSGGMELPSATSVERRTGPAKPRYLGLLNEIAEAERRGYLYLSAWADRCTDPDVEAALRTVAAREAEHSASFARRVVELGFRVRPRPDNDEERRRMELIDADLGDLATFEALGYRRVPAEGEADVFDGFFSDHSIDPATGALLGRYIAEERDSGRILRAACEALAARREVRPTSGATHPEEP